MAECYSWQSWDNVLDHIKTELGADVMKLELTDQQIVEKIQMHVLPEFSAYSGLHKWYKMFESNIISTDPVLRYQFTDFPYKIMEILGKVDKANYVDYDHMFSQSVTGDVTDYLVRQNYLDIANMVRADNSYRFIAPDIIEVNKAGFSYLSDEFILEVEVVHNDPTTIHPDMYDMFRDLATAYIMNAIGKIRKKFNNFNTPFGQIQMNAEELISDAKELRNTTLELLRRTPPDQLVWVL